MKNPTNSWKQRISRILSRKKTFPGIHLNAINFLETRLWCVLCRDERMRQKKILWFNVQTWWHTPFQWNEMRFYESKMHETLASGMDNVAPTSTRYKIKSVRSCLEIYCMMHETGFSFVFFLWNDFLCIAFHSF